MYHRNMYCIRVSNAVLSTGILRGQALCMFLAQIPVPGFRTPKGIRVGGIRMELPPLRLCGRGVTLMIPVTWTTLRKTIGQPAAADTFLSEKVEVAPAVAGTAGMP